MTSLHRIVWGVGLLFVCCVVGVVGGVGCDPAEPTEKKEETYVEPFTLPKDAGQPDASVADDGGQTPGDKVAVDTPVVVDEPPARPPIWPVTMGGGGLDSNPKIAVDAKGYVYVTGQFMGSTTVGEFKLQSQGVLDIFVAKLAPSGHVLWAVSGGSSENDSVYGIATDGKGNAYITGMVANKGTFGDKKTESFNQGDVLVAKVGTDGKWAWATVAGTGSPDEGRAIYYAANGKLYVAGIYFGKATFGTKSLDSGRNKDLFVGQISLTSGKWGEIVSRGDKESSVMVRGLYVNKSGDIFVTGQFAGDAKFGSHALKQKSGFDIFIARHDAAGSWDWAVSAGGSGADVGESITVDANGDVIVTGSFEDAATMGSVSLKATKGVDGFVAKIDGKGKTWQWAHAIGGSGFDLVSAVVADADNRLYITGQHQNEVKIGSQTHQNQNAGNDNVFVARMSATGAFDWSKSFGSPGLDQGTSIGLHGKAALFVGGVFLESMTVEGKTVTSNGSSDVFVWQFTNLSGN